MLAPVDEGLNFQFLRLNQQWAMSLLAVHVAGEDQRPERLDTQAALVAALEELSPHDAIPFFALARRAALTPLESQVMGLCLAQMLEPEIGAALARNHPHGRPQLTPVDVAQLLLGNTPEARTQLLLLLSAESNLRTACILEAPQLAWDGLIDSPLYLTRPCLAYLSGQALHAAHYRFTQTRTPKRAVVPEAQAEQIYNVVASQAAYLQRAAKPAGDEAWILVLLWGPAGAGKATFARELAGQFFAGLVELHGEAIAQLRAPHALVREALACAVIHGAMLLIENGQALLRAGGAGRFLVEALRAAPACVVVTSTERDLGNALEGAWSLVSRFAPPTPEMTVDLWRTHLPPGTPLTADVDLEALAQRYRLSGAAIARAARMATAYTAADPEPAITAQLLDQAAAAQLDDEFGDHLRTLHPAHSLDDLIVPDATLHQLRELLAAYRAWDRVVGAWGSRLATGQCLAALLHGEPGAGKTFAAEVIASTLGQPLHVVEPTADLRAVFERARQRRAILLLDDAGALLARPPLLQELDRHTGLVLLTAHLTGPIAPAVRTRLLFSVELPALDADTRQRLWQRLLPSHGPDVDLAALARTYALSGGELKNAALRATLAAHADGGVPTQRHLTDACEQLRRLQRTGSPTD